MDQRRFKHALGGAVDDHRLRYLHAVGPLLRHHDDVRGRWIDSSPFSGGVIAAEFVIDGELIWVLLPAPG